MDYVGLEAIKRAYAQDKIENGNYQRGLEIVNKPMSTPIYEGLAIHPEIEPLQKNINGAFQDMSMDFAALEKEIAHCAENYRDVLNTLVIRLEGINQQIQVEADRIKDINAICGIYSQFSTVVPITNANTQGRYGWHDNAFCGSPNGAYEYSPLEVTDIAGNGVNGNDYVDGAIASQDSHLTDDDHLTKWEYSRYTATKEIQGAPVPVNVDAEEAKATISLTSTYECNNLKISSDDNIIVEDVLVSSDMGLTYQSCLSKEMHINDPDAKYTDPEYIYESGLIAFPSAKYIKLRLRSDGVTSDTLLNKDGEPVEGVKRHCIGVNNIEAGITTYSDAEIETGELIATPVDCIAVFANEYVPTYFTEGTYIQYVLTVNGKDYEVVPINSNAAGTKVIRFSNYTVNDSYVEHLKETIKSASLKVIIHAAQDGSTPYINNLKVCLGKATV